MQKIILPKVPGVFYNLRNKSQPETLILLRMTINGEPVVWSTSLKAEPRYWDDRKQRLKMIRGKEHFIDINNALSKIAEIALSIYRENKYGQIEPEDFKKELAYRTGKKQRPDQEAARLDLFPFIEHFIKLQQEKPGAAPATWKKYQTLLNHLQAYAAENGKKSLSYAEIDWTFHRKFSDWLFSDNVDFSANTANRTFSLLRTIMRHSRRLGLHNNQIPEERGFTVRKAKTRIKVRFTLEELRTIAAYDFSDNTRLERVRDLFVVGAFCGLRFSDWIKVAEKNITRDETGARFLEIFTQKDREYLYIPVLPELAAVIDKYGKRLPDISQQKFNDYIKEAVQMALPGATFLRVESRKNKLHSETVPKWEAASSHAARKSFASNFYELGIPVFILMAITGHSTEKQFFEYIDLDKKELAKQFAKEIARKYPVLPDKPEDLTNL